MFSISIISSSDSFSFICLTVRVAFISFILLDDNKKKQKYCISLPYHWYDFQQ